MSRSPEARSFGLSEAEFANLNLSLLMALFQHVWSCVWMCRLSFERSCAREFGLRVVVLSHLLKINLSHYSVITRLYVIFVIVSYLKRNSYVHF